MKRILFFLFSMVFVIILAIPAFDMRLVLFGKDDLSGEEVKGVRVALTKDAWLDGSYQKETDAYLSQNIGLRDRLVKADNEINFRVFKEVAPPQVFTTDGGTKIVLGKDNYLYEKAYIDSYIHPKQTSVETLDTLARKLGLLQDALKERGVAFTLLVSPSKAAVYPEYIPDGYAQYKSLMPTPYDRFMPLLKKHEVNVIDGLQSMVRMKEEKPWPVFTRGGTHWNYAAACFFVQELIAHLETISNERMVQVGCEPITVDTNVFGTDKDLANLLNLPSIDHITAHPTPHPTFSRLVPDGAVQPRVLFVGGSFVWTLTSIMDAQAVYKDRDMYYYFSKNGEWPENTFEPIDTLTHDWERDVFLHDIIIIEINESAVDEAGFGFVDAALKALNIAVEEDGSA